MNAKAGTRISAGQSQPRYEPLRPHHVRTNASIGAVSETAALYFVEPARPQATAAPIRLAGLPSLTYLTLSRTPIMPKKSIGMFGVISAEFLIWSSIPARR